MRHVAVVRGSLQQPQIAIVDYKRVIRGEAPDMALQPHDIVYVPFSPYRYLQKYAELILNTFVSASAINAGINLIPNRQIGATGVFIPRFRNLDAQSKHKKFIRGYGFECGSATSMFPGMARRLISGFGSEYKKQVRRFYTSPVGMTVRAAMLSRFENYAEIDPNGIVDAWGIPVLKMHIQYSDNEREMAKDAAETSEEILRAAGAEVVSTGGQMTAPGRIIHELGTARMGNDPKTSVLNKFNQMHDVKNVFVTDGAAFVGSANHNPTLTILALTMRACEYIEDEYKRGNL